MTMTKRPTWYLAIVLFSGLLLSFPPARANTCLDGYELTAIVVLENNIRFSVESYACRMAFPGDSSTYALYSQLRDKWAQQLQEQRNMRDKVYQRIYGDEWQARVDNWQRSIPVSMSKQFKATDISCQDLRMEMVAQAHDWQKLYDAAAREAASVRYDPLRCQTPVDIRVNE